MVLAPASLMPTRTPGASSSATLATSVAVPTVEDEDLLDSGELQPLESHVRRALFGSENAEHEEEEADFLLMITSTDYTCRNS